MAYANRKTDLSTIVDDTTSTRYVYIGKAKIGSLTSEGKWRIQRIDTDNGALIEVANNGEANQIWDNRAVISYAL